MNRRSLLALTLTVLAGPLTSATQAAAPSEAQQRLQSAVNEVLAVADRSSNHAALAKSVRPVLQRYVSFGTMARRAVGPGWRQLNGDQQRKATELFTTLVIRTYSNKFTPGERPNINYQTAQTPAAGRVDVPSSLVYKGSRYSVTYRLEQENGWQIVDVVIEGVSMVANYRSQLDAAFKKGGAASVISSLEQSVAKS